MKEQSKLKSIIWVIGIIAVTALSLLGAVKYADDIKLGLDLDGGVSITYEATEENPSDVDMADTIYKIQKRVESFHCL